MNIQILVTSAILVILIILCSWNMLYENYTDLLNSDKNLLITDTNGNTSKYSVDSFLSSVNTDLIKINQDISSLASRISQITSGTDNFLETEKKLKQIENLFRIVFPKGNTTFLLRNLDTTLERSITIDNLRALTGDKSITLQNKGKLTFLTLGPSPSTIYRSGAARDQFVANGGIFRISKNLTR